LRKISQIGKTIFTGNLRKKTEKLIKPYSLLQEMFLFLPSTA